MSSLGMGKAGRGGGQSCPTLQTAPNPDRGRAPGLLATSLHSPCASPAGMGLQRQEQLEALGACWSGVGVGFLVTVVIAGVL